jgi:hypothetical protein
MIDKFAQTGPLKTRVIARAYVFGGGEVMHVADEGSRTLGEIWQNIPSCEYVVVEYGYGFYTIRINEWIVDGNAYIRPANYTPHEDLDVAIMTAVLKSAWIPRRRYVETGPTGANPKKVK